MRRTVAIILGLLTLPGTVWAQSTLVFPKVYPLAELNTTGFAVVNPGTTNATVLFSLYKPNPASPTNQGGSSSGEVVSQSSWPVPAKGQLSKLGSELFPNASAGWVEVTTTAAGLQGFWIGGDFATYADGADAARAGADLVFPLVAGQTEVNITNLSHVLTSSSATFRLLGTSGKDLTPPATRNIASRGAYQAQVSDLFPAADLSQALYLRVSGNSGTPIAGTEVVRGFLVNAESAVLNAVDVSLAGNTLNFVHAVGGSLGRANYTTVVGVVNLASNAQTVTITFHPEPSGSPIMVQRSLPPNGAIRESAQSLFSFSSDFQNGWIQISGSSPITGFVAYADTVSGGLAAVPAQTNPQPRMLFDQIAGAPTWYTGIGLLNASTTDANVQVFAMTPGGTLIGGAANVPTAAFTLPAGHKTAKLLTELIPAAAAQNGGFVYVQTTNEVPLYGIELFGSDVLPILSNVAASGLVGGGAYTPPSPSEPLKLTSISPARAVRGSTITLNGNGFGYPANNNTIVFTTAAGTVEAVASTASLTSLTATVPQTAITGPVLVRSGGQNSSTTILEVTAGETTMIQIPVIVADGQVTDSADIYVPKAAGTLNIVALGVADVGADSFLLGPFGVDLTRGQTRMLVVVGLGISQAAKSTITIPGSGVTLYDSTPVENGVLVTVKVDSNAEVGPRSVFVTNSNLDTASVPGGVYIR